MKTRLTKLLQIEQPILQGGMAWVSESRLPADAIIKRIMTKTIERLTRRRA